MVNKIYDEESDQKSSQSQLQEKRVAQLMCFLSILFHCGCTILKTLVCVINRGSNGPMILCVIQLLWIIHSQQMINKPLGHMEKEI
jgi:hypothetical protein